MRIRSIKPEFWASEDIAALDWYTRLLFIGLWSYVDDNGVGRDVDRLIVADLFPLDSNPREALARVSRGLQTLCGASLITRYEVAGKPLLHISTWSKHQRIDHRGKDRYPLPTCDDANPRETLATPSRDSRDTLALGEGEKGRRGEGLKTPSSAPRMATDDDPAFKAFWLAYPRKVSKADALKAWPKAATKAEPEQIMAGVTQLVANIDRLGTKPEHVPHPATWLNGERWNDEPEPSNGHRPGWTPANAWMFGDA